jgi:hypothetical protein
MDAADQATRPDEGVDLSSCCSQDAPQLADGLQVLGSPATAKVSRFDQSMPARRVGHIP